MKELIKVKWKDNILSRHYNDGTVDLELKPHPLYLEEDEKKSKSSLIIKLLEMIKGK